MGIMPAGQGFYSQRIGAQPRIQVWKQAGWKRGENSFSQDNEIRDDEFFEGLNIELVGKASIQLPMRGEELFATLSTSPFNGWGIFKDPITSTNIVIAMSGGRLYKVTTSGTVTEIDNSITFNSTAIMRGVLLRGSFYFGNGVDYMAKTDGTTITQWDAVTAVAGLGIVHNGTGTDTLYGYTVTAVTDVGETDMATEQTGFHTGTLSATNYWAITWTRKTDSNITGYNIYKSENGGTLTLLTFIDQPTSGATVTYNDTGVITKSLIYEAPTFNTTGGVKGNVFARYANTIFICNNLQEPDTVFFGGTGAAYESFNPSDNGGWVKPGRGDGDRCTAMIGFEDFLFIFKENSIWKFVFGSDGGPTLVSVIPQYGTSSPDSVQRMEKDVFFLGSDGRFRLLGYEPSQLNVIRTQDFSNRVQPKIDTLNLDSPNEIFAAIFEQKYIVSDGALTIPYDRRYVGFLGSWNEYEYVRFLVWDKGTGKQKLFGVKTDGTIDQLLVDNVYTHSDNSSIAASVRFKRIDAGEDTILKYYFFSKIKFRNSKGRITLTVYKDGENIVDATNISFESGGGWDEFMFDEAMFDEQVVETDTGDVISIVKKLLEIEAYSIFHKISLAGSDSNHCIIQTMNGVYEVEDIDHERDELIISS